MLISCVESDIILFANILFLQTSQYILIHFVNHGIVYRAEIDPCRPLRGVAESLANVRRRIAVVSRDGRPAVAAYV